MMSELPSTKDNKEKVDDDDNNAETQTGAGIKKEEE